MLNYLFLINLSFLLQADQLLESVVHLLDGLVFGQTHTAFVGDIVDTTLSLGVLTTGTADLFSGLNNLIISISLIMIDTVTHLEVEFAGGFLELSAVSSQFGQLDVNGSADGGAQVGGTESQETETVVMREWDPLFDVVDSLNKTGVDGLQVTTLLHRDDAQVIFLVTPNQEGLVHIVVDTTASWPVSASVGGLHCIQTQSLAYYHPSEIQTANNQCIPGGNDLPP